MAVATQEVSAHTDAKAEVWDVTAATPHYSLVKQATSARYGVTLTDTVGVARPDLDITLYGGVKVTGRTQPGVGNEEADAVGEFATGVAVDGTWEFAGVVSTGSTPTPTTTAQGTPVFATSAGALTLASSGNDRVGAVNYPGTYHKVAGKLPIQIGA